MESPGTSYQNTVSRDSLRRVLAYLHARRVPQYTRRAFASPTFVHNAHYQNGYAHASPPSSPVYASRFILAHFEDPQEWGTTRKDGAMPIQLTTPPPDVAPRERVRPTAAGHEHEHDRRAGAKIRCAYGYHPLPVFAVSTPAPPTPGSAPYMSPVFAPPSYVPPNRYTPQPSPRPYAWYGVSTIGNAHIPFRMQMPILLPAVADPTPSDVAPCLEAQTTTAPYSPRVFYTAHGSKCAFSKTPDPHDPVRAKSALGNGYEKVYNVTNPFDFTDMISRAMRTSSKSLSLTTPRPI